MSLRAVRRTSQDVSRLLDVCRQQIIFERPEDLLACVRLIIADPDLHLVQVKNRPVPPKKHQFPVEERTLTNNVHTSR